MLEFLKSSFIISMSEEREVFKMTLDEMINNYKTLQDKEDEIKKKMDELRVRIIAGMKAENKKKIVTDTNVTASISEATRLTYTDEQAIIAYLKAHNMRSFLKESINVSIMNKEIKGSQLLQENLKNFYTNITSDRLSVK